MERLYLKVLCSIIHTRICHVKGRTEKFCQGEGGGLTKRIELIFWESEKWALYCRNLLNVIFPLRGFRGLMPLLLHYSIVLKKYNFLRKKEEEFCWLNSDFSFILYLWIWIHGPKWMRIRPVPDPNHCL